MPHGVARHATNTGGTQMPVYNSEGQSKFVPEIWSSKLLEKFYDSTIFNAISNTDYEGEIKNHGDKVIIRTTPDLTVQDYTVGKDLVYETPTSESKELVIDKAKYFAFTLKDVDKVQSDLNLMNDWATDGSEQMKIAIDKTILSGIQGKADALNQGDKAGRISKNINLGKDAASGELQVGKDTILDLIVDAGTVLDEQNVPENGRWLVIPAWAAGMIKKSDLKDASLAGDNKSILRNGRLGIIDRFTIYTSNLLPTPNTADGTVAYFGHNSGISFASQITKMETVRDTKDFGDFIRSLQVFGFEVLKPESIGQMVIKKK